MASVGFLTVLLTFPLVYIALSFLLRRKFRTTYTALDDLPLLAVKRKGGRKIRGTAVICGGSITGLLSARVCSDHFENVTIVDPEAWIATEAGLHDHHREPSFQKRTRVPQYTTLHTFQPLTMSALRRLFLNFETEVHNAGGRFLPADTKTHLSGVLIPAPYYQYSNDALPDVPCLSRPAYETLLRRLVLSTCSNVNYITASVTALKPRPPSNKSVSSVIVRSQEGQETQLSAALVIALGGLRWLQASIFGASSHSKARNTLTLQALKTSYDPKMSYSTFEFDVPPNIIDKLNASGVEFDIRTANIPFALFPLAPKENLSLILGKREHNYLQFTCGGWDVYQQMEDISDLKSFASRITSERPIPDWIAAFINILEEECVPYTIVYSRVAPSVYVQYHRASHLPSNFVALGDSVLQLNPIHGQGCTKACVEAVTLNGLLARCEVTPCPEEDRDALPDEFSRTFFATQAQRTGRLWDLLRADDYGWKSTTPTAGEDTERFGAWSRVYGRQLLRLASKDREVAGAWWHVMAWLAPPTDMFSPKILMKMAWMILRAGVGVQSSLF